MNKTNGSLAWMQIHLITLTALIQGDNKPMNDELNWEGGGGGELGDNPRCKLLRYPKDMNQPNQLRFQDLQPSQNE